LSLYEQLAELERNGGSAVLATIIRDRGSVPRRAGSKMLIYPDGRSEGTIGGGELESRVTSEARQALVDGRTRTLVYTLSDPEAGDPGLCGGEVEVFIEPVRPLPTLVVVGAGHVGKAVAHLGRWLGFRVVVSDDRAELATPEAVPGADLYLHCALEELPDRLPVTDQTYLVLTTRNVTIDAAGLPELLNTPAAYVGVIGSRRRWETTAQILRDQGQGAEQIERVYSPMGLELNAETPEEIAISILAQIILVRRGGSGESMQHRPVAGRGQTP
jgi:xanthine dehydrogenase accessory factor